MIKSSIATVLLGASIGTASAAINDLSHLTHRSIHNLQMQVGVWDEPNWSDLNAVTHQSTLAAKHEFSKVSDNNYSRSDITAITHN